MRILAARLGAMALGLAALLLMTPPAWGQAEHLVRDIAPGLGSAQPLVPLMVFTTGGRFLELGGRGEFEAQELWSSDGTTSGTVLLPNPCASFCSEGPEFVANALELAFFWIDSRLWRSDGTRTGTYPLLAAGPGEALSSLPNSPAAVSLFHGALYLLAVAQSGAQQLWRTDGTAAGTSLVAEAGYPASPILTTAGGKLFFLGAVDPTGLPSLWASDGTANGTVPIHAFAPGLPVPNTVLVGRGTGCSSTTARCGRPTARLAAPWPSPDSPRRGRSSMCPGRRRLSGTGSSSWPTTARTASRSG